MSTPIVQSVPYLDIGIGTLSKRTLPKSLIKAFSFFFSDIPWCVPDIVSMRTLEDIHRHTTQRIRAVGSNKVFLFAHSAFGLLALDYAKQFPHHVQGVAMVGTPLGSNDEVARANHTLFQKHADKLRQSLYTKRCKEIKAQDLTQLSRIELFKKIYVYRDGPKYWHQMDYDCNHLWEGIDLSTFFQRFFEEILPKINVLTDLSDINVPIFLAAGNTDFDCCPWLWLEQPNLPTHFHGEIFYQSGHWPQYEEPKKFAHALIHWTNKTVLRDGI